MDRRAKGFMLVVDDDPHSRKLLEGYLSREGYNVRCAPDGPTALKLARERIPDVVLLDVMMPGMTGFEVCTKLKSSAETRLCQVMLVTALDSTPDKVEGLDTGADDYASKLVRREEFLAKVRALLRAGRLLQELERARADLAARNTELQRKKTLAQTLVHDLKNPLTAILGNLELLEMRGTGGVAPLVRRSRQGGQRMLKMILDLLDVEGLEDGKLVPSLDRVDGCDVVASTFDESQISAESKEIRLVTRGAGPAWMYADPVLLRRVVDNLVSNALSHSPTGGTVEVEVRERPEGIEIAVTDEGPGVPENLREHVFEKYAQSDLRRSGLTSNRGLGLTFCRLATEAHGGTIWVESGPLGGAIFRAIFPAAPPTANDAADRLAASA